MYVNLDEGHITNAVEAVDLASLDDQNVPCASLELLPIDRPEAPAFPYELDFVIGMAVRARPTAWEGAEEEHGDINVAVIGPTNWCELP